MKKRSVTIANRHNTSITLEPEFMEELENIATVGDVMAFLAAKGVEA